jgi:hypothetical protein
MSGLGANSSEISTQKTKQERYRDLDTSTNGELSLLLAFSSQIGWKQLLAGFCYQNGSADEQKKRGYSR